MNQPQTPSPLPIPKSLEELKAVLEPAEYQELVGLLTEAAQTQLFVPTPKQLEVVNSPADIVGYGGAAGGGKSYLVTGLCVAHHTRSAIIRPQKNQTRKFVMELTKMLRTRDGYNTSSSDWTFKTPDGAERYVQFFGLDNPGDEEKQQGIDFDGKFYDEVTQMREEDIRYTLTWNRTDDPNQRVRAVLAFNPPTTPEGRWVIRYFAPWLDPMHPNPAKDGELRYFATVGDDRDYEVAGPQKFILVRVRGRLTPWYSFNPADYGPGTGRETEVITPESRTFIHAKVTDNPYYMKTNYMQKLQALPEPLRSQMMNGDFFAGMEDNARQVIPSNWVMAAQARWRERTPLIQAGVAKLPPQDSLGVDVARGGNMGGAEVAEGADEMVISPRFGTYFAEQVIHKGIDINSGDKSSALIITERRDEAPIHLDIVGVGTSPYDFLHVNNIHVIAINGSASAFGTDASGLLQFANKRAEVYWRFRELLDPANGHDAAIPPDQQLMADLCAVRWSLTKQGILLEPKEDVAKRLGRSPDRGDSIVLANIDTPKRVMLLGGYRDAPNGHESYEARRLRELTDG